MRREAARPEPRRPQPGEPLFELMRGDQRLRGELRDHGQFGVEAQFLLDRELLIGKRFSSRVLALDWAEKMRVEYLARGWSAVLANA